MSTDARDDREAEIAEGSAPGSDPAIPTRIDLGGRDGDSDPGVEQATAMASVLSRMFSTAGEAPTIGRYSILRVIGQGAMGTVYAAYDEQLDRRVALKLLKGTQSAQARARMLREAQAMAKLSHPNVVPVFEVGEHEGQLFVAMEYVRGVTLDRFCKDASQGWRDVLDKYVQAGRGLAAAHAEGLVHRDFKPQNAMLGADGRVRVLDFGLATLHGEPSGHELAASRIGRESALVTPLTETGTVMGTPAYMAPEQARSGTADRRSDLFSFCVALWEGLYGARPFQGDSIADLFASAARGEIVQPGRTDVPAALRPLLERGLRPRPEDRWPDLPVLLGALEALDVNPSGRRRTRRIVLGLVGIGVVAAVTVPALEQHLRTARDAACAAEAEAEISATWNDDARVRVREGLVATGVGYAADTADRVLPRLDDWVGAWRSARQEACIEAGRGSAARNEDSERARWCLQERSMALHAVVEQLARADRGVVQRAVTAAAGLPRVDPCRDVGLLRRMPPPPAATDRGAVVALRERLSTVDALVATGRYEEASQLAGAAVDDARPLGDASLHAAALGSVGAVLEKTGKYADAEEALAEAYFEAVGVHDYETAASVANKLVYVVGYDLGRHGEGLRWAQHARAAIDELDLGPSDPLVVTNTNNRGAVHAVAGDLAQARAAYERALALRETASGTDHPDYAASLNNLAIVHYEEGAYDEAKALHRRALALWETTLGADHPSVAQSLQNLAIAHIATGDVDAARTLFQRALAIREAALGPDHPAFAASLGDVANVEYTVGNYAKAQALHERALAIREAALGPNHPDVVQATSNLASTVLARGDTARARALLEDVVAKREAAHGPDHVQVATALLALASVDIDAGEPGTARGLLERALAIFEAHPGAHAAETAAHFALARALVGVGADPAAAVGHARQAAEGYRAQGDRGATSLAEVEAWLAHHEPAE